ncbi:MAG TPA: hypothetical protein VHG92_15045 [Afifellaceae bacterium]|nr:hypothetical protein [Afifellaceae bacterium]
MALFGSSVYAFAVLLLPVDFGPTTPEDLAVCELPKNSFVDPLPELDDCAADVSHAQTNECLDELQDEIEALARNQAALEAQARCLCEALQRGAASSPYDTTGHRCSFEHRCVVVS